MYKLFLLCVFIGTASALPNGAPLESCGSMVPTGHQVNGEPRPQKLGYIVNALQVANEERYLIVVVGERDFKGIFIQVRQGNSPVGSFDTPPANYKRINCFGRQGSAFTHSNPTPKGISVTAVWRPPNICAGDLTVMVTVVTNVTTFETDVTTSLTCPTSSPGGVAPPQPLSPLPPRVVPPRVVPPRVVPPRVVLPQRPPLGVTPLPPATIVRPSALPPSGVVGRCRFPNVGVVPSSEYRNDFETESLNGWVNTGSPLLLGRRKRTTGGQYFQFDNFGISDPINQNSEPKWLRVRRYSTTRSNYFMRMGEIDLAPGDTVILHTGLDLSGCFCLQFDYRVLVPGDTLTIYSGQSPLTTISSGRDVWRKMRLQVESTQNTRIRLVGTKGRLSRGMMDIDNLAITKGLCPSAK